MTVRKNDIIQLLQDLGVRPKRKLGQNFLFDQNILKIVAASCYPHSQDELIIEIGAGIGTLPALLIDSDTPLIVVEFDRLLAKFLAEKYKDNSNTTVIHGNASRLDYSELSHGKSFTCIGNLPYSSSSPIIIRLLESTPRPRHMRFLHQRELAERFQSEPRRKSYGSLSVRIQALYDVKITKSIPGNVFWPMPEVRSSFVSFDKKNSQFSASDFCKFTQIVKLGFSHRRKKCISNLTRRFDPGTLIRCFKDLGIDEDVRADEVTVYQYIELARYLTGVVKYEKYEAPTAN